MTPNLIRAQQPVRPGAFKLLAVGEMHAVENSVRLLKSVSKQRLRRSVLIQHQVPLLQRLDGPWSGGGFNKRPFADAARYAPRRSAYRVVVRVDQASARPDVLAGAAHERSVELHRPLVHQQVLEKFILSFLVKPKKRGALERRQTCLGEEGGLGFGGVCEVCEIERGLLKRRINPVIITEFFTQELPLRTQGFRNPHRVHRLSEVSGDTQGTVLGVEREVRRPRLDDLVEAVAGLPWTPSLKSFRRSRHVDPPPMLRLTIDDVAHLRGRARVERGIAAPLAACSVEFRDHRRPSVRRNLLEVAGALLIEFAVDEHAVALTLCQQLRRIQPQLHCHLPSVGFDELLLPSVKIVGGSSVIRTVQREHVMRHKAVGAVLLVHALRPRPSQHKRIETRLLGPRLLLHRLRLNPKKIEKMLVLGGVDVAPI